jgi:hypothetical protein
MVECRFPYVVELKKNLECQENYNSEPRLKDSCHHTGWIGTATAPQDPLVGQNNARVAKPSSIFFESALTLRLSYSIQ